MIESPLVLLTLLRWVHVLAASMWIGGGILYLALRALPESQAPTPAVLGQTLGRSLRAGVAVFVITGTILTASRLSGPEVSGVYVSILAVKIGLAFLMFWLAVPRRRPRAAEGQAAATRPGLLHQRSAWIVGIGLVVYLLSIVLNEVIESALRSLR